MRRGKTLRSAFSASVLALTVAALGWADWRLYTLPVDAPLPVKAPRATADEMAPSASVAQVIEVPELASFAVIGERPLFVEGRRDRPATVAAMPPAEVADTPEFHLSGVMLQDGKARALIAPAGAATAWVMEGQSIGGWTVQRIHAGAAELASESGKITIELYKPAAGAP